MQRSLRAIAAGGITLGMLLLGGCASTERVPGETYDPYEGFNRAMYGFNDTLDDIVLEPISKGYTAVTPDPARAAVFNFFDNLAYVTTALNQFLQGKVERGLEDTGRFVINSTFGLAGFVDFASGIGIARNEEDFDQTLAVWGFSPGPYLELPLFGPNTVRSVPGLVVDSLTDIKTWFGNPYDIVASSVDLVDTRARLQSAIDLRDSSALDPYVFQREAYMQRRRNLIYDGNPPIESPSSSQ